MKQLKELLGDSIIYGLGSFLLKATQIFVLPLILFFLKKDEFGTLDYFLSLKNILVIIYGWGILTSIFKFTNSSLRKDHVAFNGFLVVVTITGIGLLISLLCFLIPEISIYWKEIIYIHLISTFAAFMSIPLGIYRQRREPLKYILVNVVYTIVFLGGSYFLLLTSELSYLAILLGHLFASIIAFVIGTIGVIKYIRFRFEKELFKRMLDFGFSILLNSLSFVLVLGTMRFFLKINGTFDDVGILGMAQRLSLFVGALLISPFTLAWLPFVKSHYQKYDFKETVNRVFTIFLWVGLFFCFSLELLQNDFFDLIKNYEYREATNYVLPLSFSYLLQGFYFIFSAGIFLADTTTKYKVIGVIVPIFNVVLYGIFLNKISINFVTYISLLSFLLATIMAYVYGNKRLGVKLFRFRNLFIIGLYIVLFIGISILESKTNYSLEMLISKLLFIIVLLGAHVLVEFKRK